MGVLLIGRLLLCSRARPPGLLICPAAGLVGFNEAKHHVSTSGVYSSSGRSHVQARADAAVLISPGTRSIYRFLSLVPLIGVASTTSSMHNGSSPGSSLRYRAIGCPLGSLPLLTHLALESLR